MVAAVSTLTTTLESKPSPHDNNSSNNSRPAPSSRPPLLPSERGNGGGSGGGISRHNNNNNTRRPRGREIPSRYLSSSPSHTTSTTTTTTSTSTSGSSTLSSSSSASSSSISRRFPSPLVSRTNNNNNNNNPNISTPGPKRSVSVDRRRSVTPKPPPQTTTTATTNDHPPPPSAASKLLVTSTRSLSVSFQGQAFSLPVSKTKAVNNGGGGSGGRKSTPERRRSTPNRVTRGGGDGEQQQQQIDSGTKPLDQHRWPARNRQTATIVSRSSDYCDTGTEGFLESTLGMRNLRGDSYTPGGGVGARASFDGILSLDRVGSDVIGVINSPTGVNLVNENSDLTASDTDSVSSESTSGAHDNNSVGSGGGVPRGIVSSARFWQETNMRLRRLRDSGSGVISSSPKSAGGLIKGMNPRKFSDGPMMSPRAMSSPIRGAVRAASPSKMMTAVTTPMPMRGVSPSRMRSSISRSLSDNLYDTPSVLSYVVDVRRGKVGENKIIDAHQLRVLYNRQLQWRFVNARAEAALLVQKQNVEKNLWNAWITITGLRDSVRQRRAQLQLLRQKLKLSSILKGQVSYLEEWSLLDMEHSSSLQGAIEALKASTLRLPVIGGAIVDIPSVKDAVGSAVDVMQAMTSSLFSLLNKVDEVNCMVAELATLSGKETALLRQCKDVLSAWTSLEVKDCSLRTNIMQINRLPIA